MERAKGVPPQMVRKYFQRGQGQWKEHLRIKEDLRRMVTFRRFNLLTDQPPAQAFDVIFCRNVLIYFDNLVKEKVINRLYGVLKSGGHFIIGGAESLNNIKHRYKYIRPSVYKKV